MNKTPVYGTEVDSKTVFSASTPSLVKFEDKYYRNEKDLNNAITSSVGLDILAGKVSLPKSGPYSGIEISWDGLKQFLAIVAGESSDNVDEAAAIGSVILNRLEAVDADMKGDFISKIGGEDDFDAIGGKIYNEVMGYSDEDFLVILANNPKKDFPILGGEYKYADRFRGALAPITNGQDYSKGAYIWNATSQRSSSDIGFNWRAYNRGAYIITATYGLSTFFNYSKKSGRAWRQDVD